MNINTAAKGVRICSFETAQPDNSGHDGITARSVWAKDLASPPSVVEDGSERRMVANFFGYLE